MLKRFFGLDNNKEENKKSPQKPEKVLIKEAQDRALEYSFLKLKDKQLTPEFLTFFENFCLFPYKNGVANQIRNGLNSEQDLATFYSEFISDFVAEDGPVHCKMEFLQNLTVALCFYESCINLTNDHLDVLLSKKNQLVYKDEFGDEVKDKWESYFNSYFSSKLGPAVDDWISANRLTILNIMASGDLSKDGTHFQRTAEDENEDLSLFESFVELQADLYVSFMGYNSKSIGVSHVFEGSGHEYEYHLLSKLQSETSVNVEVTSGSGDQGADLIVYYAGNTYIIQAKHYASPVGNKAVQEAFSALSYYQADYGIVVANSGFTKSATDLALRTGVMCVTELQLVAMFNDNLANKEGSDFSKQFFELIEENFDNKSLQIEDLYFDNEEGVKSIKLDLGEAIFLFFMGKDFSGSEPSEPELEFYEDLLEDNEVINIVKIVPDHVQPDILEALMDIQNAQEDGRFSFVTEKEGLDMLA